MRHISMMPPEFEPPYRRRHEERKERWVQSAVIRAQVAMMEARIHGHLEEREMMLRGPVVPFVN